MSSSDNYDSGGTRPGSSGTLLDALAEEFSEKLRAGQNPSVDDYVDKYPEFADRIRKLFPTLELLEAAATASASDESPGLAGRRVGEYRLLREIGRGGMGIVYEAVQDSLQRRVALKVLPESASGDPLFIERFRLEASAAARLDHPGIVPVYGAGTDGDVNFFAMLFVDGHGLDAVMRELRAVRDRSSAATAADDLLGRAARSLIASELGREGSSTTAADRPGELDSPQRQADVAALPGTNRQIYYRNAARIALDAAEAVAYAHGQGILHRDLKPSNILFDVRGRVWIADFGLCKTEESGDLTQSQALLGTLRYVPPERFSGESDVRGDVYGLGITLHELLTLEVAYGTGDHADLIGRITRGDLARPRDIDAEIPKDLEQIVLKATAVEASERYQTAAALADDLRAFLDGRPIAARPPSALYLLRMALARNRLFSTTLIVALLVLVTTTVLYFVWIQREWRRAERNAGAARASEERKVRESAIASLAAAAAAVEDGDAPAARKRLEEVPVAHRGWEWSHFHARVNASLRDFPGDQRVAKDLRHSPDGSVLAAAIEPSIVLFDLETATVVRRLDAAGNPSSIDFSRDGRWLAASTYKGFVRVWDWRSGELVRQLDVTEPSDRVLSCAFSLDGQWIAAGCRSHVVYVWDWSSGELVVDPKHMEHGGVVHNVLFTDDRQLLTGAWDGVVRAWELPAGRLAHEIDTGVENIRALALSRSSDVLAVGGKIRALVLYDLATGERLPAPAVQGNLTDLAFSGDDRWLAATSWDGTVTLWERAAYDQPIVFMGTGRPQESVSFDPESRRLVSGSWDGAIREWTCALPAHPSVWTGHLDDVGYVLLNRDGSWLLTVSRDGSIRVWDVESGEQMAVLIGAFSVRVAFSSDGRNVLVPCGDQVFVWDPLADVLHDPFEHHSTHIERIVAASKGGGVLTIDRENALARWDGANGTCVRMAPGATSTVRELAIDNSGQLIAAATVDGSVWIWNTATLEPLHQLVGHSAPVCNVAFSPDSQQLASVSEDQTLRLWSVVTGELTAVLGRPTPGLGEHTETIQSVAYSPDGKRIATGSRDSTIRLWDPHSGDEVAVLRGHKDWVYSLVFTPDGSRLISASSDRTVRIWDAVPLRDREPALYERWRLQREADAVLTQHGANALAQATGAPEVGDDRSLDPLQRAVLLRSRSELGTAGHLLTVAWSILQRTDATTQEKDYAMYLVYGGNNRNGADHHRMTMVGVYEYRVGRAARALYCLDQAGRKRVVKPWVEGVRRAFLILATEAADSDSKSPRAALQEWLAGAPEAESARAQPAIDEVLSKPPPSSE